MRHFIIACFNNGFDKKSILKLIFIFNLMFLSHFILVQKNYLSAQEKHNFKKSEYDNKHDDYSKIDSLKPIITDIVITGNRTTKDDIILREMQLGKGKVFSSEQCKEDQSRLYNLGIFSRADITPELQPDNKILLKVTVDEKWYIYPIPEVGFVDGEVRKLWVGANVRWQNFRGRNERVALNFGIGYNSFIKGAYTVPWIGEDLHLFTTFSGGYSIDKNRSWLALGRANGSTVSYRSDSNNFNYQNLSFKMTIGKYFSKIFSIYSDIGYSMLSVDNYQPGRTLSSNGTDKFILLGLGMIYDSRNNREFTMKGYSLIANYQHFGLISDAVNFGRFTFDQQSFIPINFNKDYSISLATKLYSSIVVGSTIPYYNHKVLGYGGDYVRGWYYFGFEGDNQFSLYNEIRIPIIQPDYLKMNKLPVLKNIRYVNSFSARYGLYFTMFYDIGAIWNEDDQVKSIKMLNGTGIGLNAIFPFGFIGKAEWAFRLGNPVVGQLVLGLGAKF